MYRHTFWLLLAGMFLAAFGNLEAGLIQADTATASSFFSGDYDPGQTIDGSGLPLGFTATDAHAAYAAGNHWTTAAGTTPTDAWIIWGFNAPQLIDRIHIWNHQSNGGIAANSGYDVTLFDLTLFDSSNIVLFSMNDVSLDPDTDTVQTFFFSGDAYSVSSVRFDINNTEMNFFDELPNYTGLAEVAFELEEEVVEAVPEPASFALLTLASLGGIGLRLRRRQPAIDA